MSMKQNNFLLRDIEDSDHEWLLSIYNDPLVRRNNRKIDNITLDDHLDWWESVKDNPKEERFIFCDGKERIGFAKIYDIDTCNKNCLLGADIHKDHRGKGYALPLWTLMIDRCFSVHKLHRLALYTAEYNQVGIHVYKKLGFKEEGRMVHFHLRDGKFYDTICMYMLETDWSLKEREVK